MRLEQDYTMERIGNRSEELVYEAIGNLLEEGGIICPCEDCVMDLAAWTLNHVVPQYYTSLLPPFDPDPRREREVHNQMKRAIASGIKRLKSHPHHG